MFEEGLVHIAVKYDFPGELRFRYPRELKGHYHSFMKSVDENGDHTCPTLIVKNLPINEEIYFDLVTDNCCSVQENEFCFYENPSKKSCLTLQDHKMIYKSNGEPVQEIKFENVGIQKDVKSKSDGPQKRCKTLTALRIRYSSKFFVVYSRAICEKKVLASPKKLTITDYVPTHVARDLVNPSTSLLIFLKENVTQKNIDVVFFDESRTQEYVVGSQDLEIIKQSVIRLRIPPSNIFQSEDVFFVVRYEPPESKTPVHSEAKKVKYLYLNRGKRRHKDIDNFHRDDFSDGVREKLKRLAMNRLQTQQLQQQQCPVIDLTQPCTPMDFIPSVSIKQSISDTGVDLDPLDSPSAPSQVDLPRPHSPDIQLQLQALNDFLDEWAPTNDQGEWETDGCVDSVELGVRQMSFELDSDAVVYFDVKGPRRSNKDSKLDLRKKSQATNEAIRQEKYCEMVNRCVQQIFHVPHWLALHMELSDIFKQICRKVPEILTGADKWGDGPLNNALLKDNNVAAEFLLNMLIECNATAHLNDANDDGHTPLILLTNSSCDEKLAAILLKHGAQILAVDNVKRTVFHHAICNKKMTMLHILLRYAYHRKMLYLLQQEDVECLTPLHLATLQEYCPLMLELLLKFLLLANGNPNHLSSRNGMGALHMAITHRLLVSLDTLLKCRAVDLNVCTSDGRSPHQLAVQSQLPSSFGDLQTHRGAVSTDICTDDVGCGGAAALFTYRAYLLGLNNEAIRSETDLRRLSSMSGSETLLRLAESFIEQCEWRGSSEDDLLTMRRHQIAIHKNVNNVDAMRDLLVTIWRMVS